MSGPRESAPLVCELRLTIDPETARQRVVLFDGIDIFVFASLEDAERLVLGERLYVLPPGTPLDAVPNRVRLIGVPERFWEDPKLARLGIFAETAAKCAVLQARLGYHRLCRAGQTACWWRAVTDRAVECGMDERLHCALSHLLKLKTAIYPQVGDGRPFLVWLLGEIDKDACGQHRLRDRLDPLAVARFAEERLQEMTGDDDSERHPF